MIERGLDELSDSPPEEKKAWLESKAQAFRDARRKLAETVIEIAEADAAGKLGEVYAGTCCRTLDHLLKVMDIGMTLAEAKRERGIK